MELLRARYTVEPLSANLRWNLILATVPLLCSSVMLRTARQNRWWLTSLLLVIWLLFLPNAPYILTDLFHFQTRQTVPEWIDLAVLLTFAGAGLMLCYLSLTDVQTLVQRKLGAKIGWAVACTALMLCGVGIYLGRYLRLNSWYVVTHPRHLFHKSLYRIGIDQTMPGLTEFTLVYGLGLITGYLALHVLLAAIRDPQ